MKVSKIGETKPASDLRKRKPPCILEMAGGIKILWMPGYGLLLTDSSYCKAGDVVDEIGWDFSNKEKWTLYTGKLTVELENE